MNLQIILLTLSGWILWITSVVQRSWEPFFAGATLVALGMLLGIYDQMDHIREKLVADDT